MKKFIFYIICASLFFAFSCKKDKAPQASVPELTTTAVSNITANTAMSGGTISSNGAETITITGICWSAINHNPTISDDTTKGTTTSGSFTAMMKNLTSSSTYYVRAYATNRVGTGYGNVVTFNTGNGVPVATAVSITGTPKGDELLTGVYTYSDPENDAEAETTFQWYVANDGAGTGEIPIDGATEKTFRVGAEQEGKYIRFGVTPKAAAGNKAGAEVKSAFTTAVGEATTVTFMYNNEEVTYGIIVGPSGKKWLDRNLGASRAATSATDYQAYGDLFQWGRLADGHQRIIRTNVTDAGASGVNGTTTILSPTDIPATNAFIIASGGTYDWRATSNDNLWQGLSGVNNPCPEGWRIATQAEWVAEGITTIDDGFSKLGLTYTGYHDVADGTFQLTDVWGSYWTSTVSQGNPGLSFHMAFFSDAFVMQDNNRGNAYACRCVRD